MKTIGQLINLPEKSDSNKQLASCREWEKKLIDRFKDSTNFLLKVTPDMQAWCCDNPDKAFFADFPTLSQLRALGTNTAKQWLVPQLTDLSEFCGAREKLTDRQLEDLAYIVSKQFYYLKISEVMLFLMRFKSGQYGRFYGTVDPLIITTALREFCKERAVAIEQHDQEEKQRLREQAAAEAVTWEEYREKYAVTNDTNPFEREPHVAEEVKNDTMEDVLDIAKVIEYGCMTEDARQKYRDTFKQKYGFTEDEFIKSQTNGE